MPPKPTNTEGRVPAEAAITLAKRFWSLRISADNLPFWHELSDEEQRGKIENARRFIETELASSLEDSFKERVREALLGEQVELMPVSEHEAITAQLKDRADKAEAALEEIASMQPKGLPTTAEQISLAAIYQYRQQVEREMEGLRAAVAEMLERVGGDGVGAGVSQSKGSTGRSSEVKASAPAEGLFSASVDSVTSEMPAGLYFSERRLWERGYGNVQAVLARLARYRSAAKEQEPCRCNTTPPFRRYSKAEMEANSCPKSSHRSAHPSEAEQGAEGEEQVEALTLAEVERLVGLCEMNLRDTAQGVEATEAQQGPLADKLRSLRSRLTQPVLTVEQARMRLREAMATHEWPKDGTGEEYFIRAAFPSTRPFSETTTNPGGEDG